MSEANLAAVFATVTPLLDERQRRVFAGAQASAFGRGGIAAVCRASGLSRDTVKKAVGEIAAGLDPSAPVRRAGAGRKRLADKDPGLLADLDRLVDRESRGDPMCPLRWTSESTGKLAAALGPMGHEVSPDTVGRLLGELGFSLHALAKQREGDQHPDRDAQFVYLSSQVAAQLASGQPVISVDTKKKLVTGQLKNNGREYQPKGSPERVDVHDFPDPNAGKAIPYGVYDIGANEGFVSVGDDHDTAAFAVATIGRWWDTMGQPAYPEATRLLITADAGGSNGHRVHLWKVELAKLAARTGLTITLCHFPPGTSKWNKIDLIGATTTSTGLDLRAERDSGTYPKGIKFPKKVLDALPLHRHDFHGDWNYTVTPPREVGE